MLMCFGISFAAWQLYTRDRYRNMMNYAFGFALIGLSGTIQSFNLTTGIYLGLIFIGRIGGYALILRGVSYSNTKHEKETGNLFYSLVPFFSSVPGAYFISALITGLIVFHSNRRRRTFRSVFTRNFTISFLLIFFSEGIFVFANTSPPVWMTAQLFQLCGYAILSWTFFRFPRLRIVDKLHIVLRGLVLFSVIAVIIPVTLLMFYNIRQDALASVSRDSRSIDDYIEIDKQRVLRTAEAIAENPGVTGILENKKYKNTSLEPVVQLQLILRETGNDFLLVLDKDRKPIINFTGSPFEVEQLSDLWLVNRAFQGQHPVTVEENFVSPLVIVSAAPIRKEGKVLGIVITGLNITDSYLKGLKKSLQLDVNIYHGDRLVATSFDLLSTERNKVTREANVAILNQVLDEKQVYLGEPQFMGRTYYAAIAPLLGSQQHALGMIFTGIAEDEFEYRKSEILAILIMVSIPITLLAWFFGARMSRNITQSVESLSRAAQLVAQGNLDVEVPVASSDELAELSRLFNQMTVKLKEIDTMKSDFYSFISHEIRTPLTALQGASEALLEVGTDSFTKDQKMMLQIIVQNSQRLSRLVNNLLELAKLEAGKMNFTKVPVDINGIIAKSLETFDPLARKSRIMLLFTPIPDLPKTTGDPDWILQVVNNLVSNAIKFTEDGGRIFISAEQKSNSTIEVRVKDTGIGIPQNELEHIFDKYHQVRSSLTNKIKGTGLGLSICKHIIEEVHHGKIWVESEEGRGSTFIFVLPLVEVKL